jgi:5-(carboxyamino)imidazole ribonucleotide synthase
MSEACRRVGILGGGQLAWMLAQAAHEVGHTVWGLIKSPDEPLTQLPEVTTRTPELIAEFARNIDVLCFESEFFDPKWVESVLAANPKVKVRPGLDTMMLLRDKLQQKKLLASLSIPHPEYFELRESQIEADLLEAKRLYRKGFVIKRALGGYDGRGNFFVKKGALDDKARDFCRKAFVDGSRLYAENLVNFEKELAIVAVACESRGEFISYPLMFTRQVEGACQEVWGPAVQLGVDAELALQASSWAMSVAKHCPDLACFALEFFWDPERGLLLNEIAPRVHNSGHFTQLEASCSQFHNHIRAVTDDGLIPFNSQGFYLMRNLLGPKESAAQALDPRRVEDLSPLWSGDFYWYSKSLLVSGRKMGHVNLKESHAEAVDAARIALETQELRFWSSLTRSSDS